MQLHKNSIILFLFFITSLGSVAQTQPKKETATGDPKQADSYYKADNFEGALDEYVVLLKKEPDNDKYNYRAGVCYINTDIDKTKSIALFEKIAKTTDEPDIDYMLGRAYQYAYKFDKALEYLKKYKEGGKGTSENMKDADLQIQYCNNAKELMEHPVNVSFENLGKNVNSEYPDYFPFVTADESFLIFNTKRPGNGAWQNPDGTWDVNIYMSKVKDGQYSKAKPIGKTTNLSLGVEEAVGLSANGEYLLVFYNDFQGASDIYISKADKNKTFKNAILLDAQINSMRGQEIAASISADGNAIYFASTKPGGLGGSDLYVCQRLPNNKWSPAKNLGPEINTPYNEDFPNISPDGKTLYFSSMGKGSMGGYDIFYSQWNEKESKFLSSKNLGFPVNSPEDDMNFRVSATGKYGYISTKKKDSFGDLDIYRLNFIDMDPEYTVITGKVRSKDIARPVDSVNVFISVTDAKTGDEFGTYIPNPNSGRYVIILPSGKYKLNTEIPGYQKYSEAIEIFDKSSFKKELEKNILLVPELGSTQEK